MLDAMLREGAQNSEHYATKSKLYLCFILCIFSFTAMMSLISYSRYMNFFTSNWDLGINIQMLSSTKDGMLLYESGDFEVYGVLSHLEIHSTYISIPLSFLYSTISSPATLFVIQGFMVSLGIIPLYYISKKLQLSKNYSAILIAAYLFNFPMMASMMYDYHWMSFIPFEFLSLFILIWNRRYALSAIFIIFGSFTLEVFPFLSLGILLYFFIDRGGLKALTKLKELFSRQYIYIYILGILSLILFLFDRVMQTVIIPHYIGNESGIENLMAYGLTPLIPSNFNISSLSLPLTYWPILYASVGFIPFLEKKHVILNIPWIYDTFLLSPTYAYIKAQYALIAMPAIIIGLAFGLRKLSQSHSNRYLSYILFFAPLIGILIISANLFSITMTAFLNIFYVLAAAIVAIALFFFLKNAKIRKIKETIRGLTANNKVAIGIFIVILLIFNFMASPLNTNNDSHSIDNGYSFSYTGNPEFQAAIMVARMIPGNASVVSSDNLFPFVATDMNAYSFYWQPLSSFDGKLFNNFSHPSNFEFILVDQSQMNLMPQAFLHAIDNSSLFGVYASVITNISYPGNIILYKAHYEGSVTTILVK